MFHILLLKFSVYKMQCKKKTHNIHTKNLEAFVSVTLSSSQQVS